MTTGHSFPWTGTDAWGGVYRQGFVSSRHCQTRAHCAHTDTKHSVPCRNIGNNRVNKDNRTSQVGGAVRKTPLYLSFFSPTSGRRKAHASRPTRPNVASCAPEHALHPSRRPSTDGQTSNNINKHVKILRKQHGERLVPKFK